MTLVLAGWAYYVPVEISNPNDYDLLDFQVLIQLDTNNFDFSKAKDDGSDIRFTLSDGETLIPHWIEEWDSTNQMAKIWVKVPSISANGSTTILLWCGNPDAVDASDGDSVFLCFDDFEGTSLDTNKWQEYGSSVSLNNGLCSITDDAIGHYIDDIRNKIITARIVEYSSGNYGGFGIYETFSMHEDVCYEKGFCFNFTSKNSLTYLDWNDGSRDRIFLTKPIPALFTFKISGNSVEYIYNNELLWTKQLPITEGYIKFVATNGNNMKIDYIFIRKYADKEPTCVIGTLQPVNTTIITATLTTINVSKALETFTGDGATTVFTVQNKPIIPKVRVWVDGTELVEGTDFTVDYDNGTITFATAPASGSTIEILYFYGYIDIVPNATVNITDSAGNTINTTTTDAKGDYSIEVPTNVTLYAVADTTDFDAKTEFKVE